MYVFIYLMLYHKLGTVVSKHFLKKLLFYLRKIYVL